MSASFILCHLCWRGKIIIKNAIFEIRLQVLKMKLMIEKKMSVVDSGDVNIFA